MWQIANKELSLFFASPIGYVVLGVFILVMGLMLWVFGETSILASSYAGIDQLFAIAPAIFIFLIPAVTMRSFSEEFQFGTIEILKTKPISDISLILGKFLASFILVLFALAPTLLYYYSVYQLGSPVGNIDAGATIGSYIGLVFLAAAMVSIGIFCSTLSKNQIVSFVIACLICFLMLWGFEFIGDLPMFFGSLDGIIKKIGLNYHYVSISRGMLDTRDLIYFVSVVFFFLFLSHQSIQSKTA